MSHTQFMRVPIPLAVLPEFKLHRAIFLTQMHFLAQTQGEPDESGALWFPADGGELGARFPFFCARSLQSYLSDMLGRKLLLRRRAPGERCPAYRVDLSELRAQTGVDLEEAIADKKNVRFFSPYIAARTDVTLALLLQQTLFWCRTMHKSSKYRGDIHQLSRQVSFYKPLYDWHADFPFLHPSTVTRALYALRGAGLILTRSASKHATWYAPDGAAISLFFSDEQHEVELIDLEIHITRKNARKKAPLPDRRKRRKAGDAHTADREFSPMRALYAQLLADAVVPINQWTIRALSELRPYKRLHTADVEKIRRALYVYPPEMLLDAIQAAAHTGKASWQRIWAKLFHLSHPA